MVIGYSNDIHFYRELLRRGISEYVVAPIAVIPLISTISGIYRDASSAKLGKIYAFVGAKGGVGSSTIAHNVGWTMSQRFGSDVVLADLDLPFGTAGLDFNIDVSQGIVEAIQDTSRLDEMLLDRLLTKLDDHFSLLAAPAKLDRPYDLNADAFASLLEIAQANVPFTILDVPHVWTSWARNALIAADEIVITAAPDLANLRNAKNLISFLKQARPHDAPPKLVLNQIGLAKRPEIKPNEFARALEMEPLAHVPFDAHLFGIAANNGKMISAISSKSPAAHAFAEMAAGIAGRTDSRSKRTGLFNLRALLGRKRQAS
jgi:pilus assembly protein CpaE